MSNEVFIKKYRPKSLNEFELDPNFSKILQTSIYTKNVNILLVGHPGNGKTSIINTIVEDYYQINPNFNYTEKALSTSIFAIDTDKMAASGYESTEVGFRFGTNFEQYNNLYFSPVMDFEISTCSKVLLSIK